MHQVYLPSVPTFSLSTLYAVLLLFFLFAFFEVCSVVGLLGYLFVARTRMPVHPPALAVPLINARTSSHMFGSYYGGP